MMDHCINLDCTEGIKKFMDTLIKQPPISGDDRIIFME